MVHFKDLMGKTKIKLLRNKTVPAESKIITRELMKRK